MNKFVDIDKFLVHQQKVHAIHPVRIPNAQQNTPNGEVLQELIEIDDQKQTAENPVSIDEQIEQLKADYVSEMKATIYSSDS